MSASNLPAGDSLPVRVVGIQWNQLTQMPAPWNETVGGYYFAPGRDAMIVAPRVVAEHGVYVTILRLLDATGRRWYEHVVSTVDVDERYIRAICPDQQATESRRKP